jgi:hypothetical protein
MVDGGLDFVPLVDWGLEFGRLRWTGVWVSFSTSPEIWILGARWGTWEGKCWNLVDLVCTWRLESEVPLFAFLFFFFFDTDETTIY